MKKLFPIFGNGNGRPVFPGMAGNRSPLGGTGPDGDLASTEVIRMMKCIPVMMIIGDLADDHDDY